MIKRYLPKWLRTEAVDFALECFSAFAFLYILALWFNG
jgi:hypothetical protein